MTGGNLSQEYYLYGCENISSALIVPFRPWETSKVTLTGPSSGIERTRVLTYYTAVAGQIRDRRVQFEENPPSTMRGIVLDYDSPWQDCYFEILQSLKVPPTFINISKSGNFHLVWLSKRDFPVLDSKQYKQFLVYFSKRIFSARWVLDYDKASERPAQIFQHVGKWVRCGPPAPFEAFLSRYWAKFGLKNLETALERDSMDHEEAYKILCELPAFRWPGAFTINSRGPSWWLIGSDSEDSAMVLEEGMVTFSGCSAKRRYTWQEVISATRKMSNMLKKEGSVAEAPLSSPPVEKDAPAAQPSSGEPEEEKGELLEESQVEDVVDRVWRLQNPYGAISFRDANDQIIDTDRCRLQRILQDAFKLKNAPLLEAMRRIEEKPLVAMVAWAPGLPSGAVRYESVPVFANLWSPQSLPAFKPSATEDFPRIQEFLQTAFPDKAQLTALYTWMAHLFQSFLAQKPTPGRGLCLYDETDVSRTVIVNRLFHKLFGGTRKIQEVLTRRSAQTSIDFTPQALAAGILFADFKETPRFPMVNTYSRDIQERIIAMLLIDRRLSVYTGRALIIGIPWAGRLVLLGGGAEVDSSVLVNILARDYKRQNFMVLRVSPKAKEYAEAQSENWIEEELPAFARWLQKADLASLAGDLYNAKAPSAIKLVCDEKLRQLIITRSEYHTYLISVWEAARTLISPHDGDWVELLIVDIARYVNDDPAYRYVVSRNIHGFKQQIYSMARMFPSVIRLASEDAGAIAVINPHKHPHAIQDAVLKKDACADSNHSG